MHDSYVNSKNIQQASNQELLIGGLEPKVKQILLRGSRGKATCRLAIFVIFLQA